MKTWHDFVLNLMGNADHTPTEITPDKAAEWIGFFEQDQIPDGLTPERFADIWNQYVKWTR